MYTSTPYKYTTKASTNLTPLSGASETAKIAGIVMLNTSATADVYAKFYWSRQGEVPVVGTAIPDITIGCAADATLATTISQTVASFDNSIGRMGQLYMWVTALPADTDATATAAGDGIVTVLLQY